MKDTSAQNERETTTPEENREIIRRVIKEGVNEHRLEVFREMLAPDYARHSQATTEAPEIRGVEAMLEFLQASFIAFPDWQEKIELMIAEGDKVAYITTGTGAHSGPPGTSRPRGSRWKSPALGRGTQYSIVSHDVRIQPACRHGM